MTPAARRPRGAATAFALGAIVALAFLLRCSNAATVFVGDRVVLPGNDPNYHLRRILLVLADYPRVPIVDPRIDPPRGAPVILAPLFDLGIASLARATGLGPGDRRAVEVLAAFVPPAAGALTCAATWLVARRLAGPAAGLLAALVLALFPAHAWYSRLGYVDHHVAATLLHVASCAAALRALRVGRERAGTGGATPRPAATALAAVLVAVGMLSWNGYPLLVATLDAPLLAVLAACPGRRPAILRFAAALHLGAALLVLPGALDVAAQTGERWSVLALSLAHPLVLAAIGLSAALLAARPFVARGARLVAPAAIAAVAATAVGTAGFERVARWFTASDPFMSAVQESVSVLRGPDGSLDVLGTQHWMTRFFPAAPLLLAALGARLARGGTRDAGRIFLFAWAAVFTALPALQRRFGETAGPAIAALAAEAIATAAAALRRRLAPPGTGDVRARAAGFAGAAAGLLIVGLGTWPWLSTFADAPGRAVALLRAPVRGDGTAVPSEGDLAEQRASGDVRRAAALARIGEVARREDARDGIVDGARPAAMNPWPLGHALLHTADMPVTATPFGTHVGGAGFADSTRFFLAGDEDEALAILARRRTRWVVTEDALGTIGAAIVARGGNPRLWYDRQDSPTGTTHAFRPPLLRTMWYRLTHGSGSELLVHTADGKTERVPALGHFRLVADEPAGDGPPSPTAWQVIRGAVLVVRASPGERVLARYAWTSDTGRARIHETTATADESGEARLVLPYPSDRPDLGFSSRWTWRGKAAGGEVAIAERDVREGGEVRVDEHAMPSDARHPMAPAPDISRP